MKILLVQPRLNPYAYSLGRLEPLGLEVIAATVPEHAVEILDMRLDSNLRQKLADFQPDVVGITAYSVEVSSAKQALKEIKEFDHRIITIVGGHHATMIPQDFNQGDADIIVKGHGFTSFPQIIQALEHGNEPNEVKGLLLAKDGQLISTGEAETFPDINAMPLPNRSLTQKYRRRYMLFGMGDHALITTAIGCPYRCNFCACWKFAGGKYYRRSPESIADELAGIREKNVFFGDDNTFQDIHRCEKLYEIIKEKKIHKIYGGYARADTIAKHPALFKKWSEIGLRSLVVGFEATNEWDLQAVGKKCSVADNERAFRILEESGITNLAHFLVRQDFTHEDFDHLYQYIERHNLWLPFYTILTPLPGTDLYQRIKSEIITSGYDLFDLAHNVLPTRLPLEEFSREVYRLFVRTWSFIRYAKTLFYNLAVTTKNGPSHLRKTHLPLLMLIALRLQSFYFFTRQRWVYRKFLTPHTEPAHHHPDWHPIKSIAAILHHVGENRMVHILTKFLRIHHR